MAALESLKKVAKKSQGDVLTQTVAFGWQQIERGPNAGKWVAEPGHSQYGASEPERRRQIGDVKVQREGRCYYLWISVPFARFNDATTKAAIDSALPELTRLANDRFFADNPGAELYVD